MNKKELKTLIKPMVKECIHEILLEEGLLSNVVAEVAKGMSGNLVVESKQTRATPAPPSGPSEESMQKRKEKRRKLLDAIGRESYNGVNVFEGTEALSGYEAKDPAPGSVDLGNPSDPGVDISSLMGGASRMWDAMK